MVKDGIQTKSIHYSDDCWFLVSTHLFSYHVTCKADMFTTPSGDTEPIADSEN